MIKKPVCLLLAFCLLLSIAACGTSDQEPSVQGAVGQETGTDAAASEPALPASLENAPSPAKTGREPRVAPRGDGEDAVTVMLYMCGSDLESDGGAATADINEILYATLNDRVNVIIETGGASAWQNSVVDADINQRWLVTGDGLELLDDAGRQNMTSPQTLSAFIQFCAEKYPANRNILVF